MPFELVRSLLIDSRLRKRHLILLHSNAHVSSHRYSQRPLLRRLNSFIVQFIRASRGILIFRIVEHYICRARVVSIRAIELREQAASVNYITEFPSRNPMENRHLPESNLRTSYVREFLM